MQYFLVLLQANAPSFCYYPVPETASGNLMAIETLNKVIRFAGEQDAALNFIQGTDPLPKEYDSIIRESGHPRIVPLERAADYPDSVVIINENHSENDISSLDADPSRNLIVRTSRDKFAELPRILSSLVTKFKRCNLILTDIPSFKESDFDSYSAVLASMAEIVFARYKSGNPVELSTLTDRIVLEDMSNCNAGDIHATIAPDGTAHICPGFYHNFPENTVGSIADGVAIKNRQLYSIEHAPICSVCDAFQCKRCIYLNRLLTQEVNTPSHEQCVVSHREREASRLLREKLQTVSGFPQTRGIQKRDYEDPFDALPQSNADYLGGPKFTRASNTNEFLSEREMSGMTERQLLIRLLREQVAIKKHINQIEEKLKNVR